MKSFVSTAGAVLLTLGAELARAHYTFPDFPGDAGTTSDYQYVRMTQNHYSQAPVTDVTSPLLRCYENDTASATSITTVTAGKSYNFGADQAIYHPGYTAVYMAQVSDFSESAGDGSVWFKIYEDAPVYSPSGSNYYTFPSTSATSVAFTIPGATPSGNYLIRVEQIALHSASSFGGAQFYIGCAQVKLSGGGSGTPGPLVAIPGVYTGKEPGILINIYGPNPDGKYTSPGPSVWSGGNGGGGYSPPPSTTAVTKPTTTAVTKPTTSSSSSPPATTSASGGSGGTVAHYGQCGGSGYTGPTTCASPYKCTVSNQYYSQCL